MSNEPTLANHSVVLAAGDGQHYEFLNHVATVKLTGTAGRSMSVVEFHAPRGFGPPEHRHNHEDELFFVTDGELRFFTGGEQIDTGAGAFAYLPLGIPHTFQVLSETARYINVTACRDGVPRFDEMVSSLGVRTGSTLMPEPGYIDPAEVAAVCAAHGIDILGPPPPPL